MFISGCDICVCGVCVHNACPSVLCVCCVWGLCWSYFLQLEDGGGPASHLSRTGPSLSSALETNMPLVCSLIPHRPYQLHPVKLWGFPGGSVVKSLPTSAGDAGIVGSIPGSGRSPEKGMATHSSTLAWKIPRMEEPGRLQSLGLQRVRHG